MVIVLQSASSQMIYADQKVAAILKGKMAKRHADRIWEVVKVTTGWQVQEVVEKPKVVTLPKAAHKLFVSSSHVEVSAKFQRETGSWLYFSEPIGNGVLWLHKNHVVSWAVTDGVISMQVPSTIAAKKKLVA